jgi:di/tripeptidase
MINKQHIINRFISYVTIDTESDPESDTTPVPKNNGILPTSWLRSSNLLG